MVQFQENAQTDGRMEGWTDPISQDPSKRLVLFPSLRVQMMVCCWCRAFALGTYEGVVIYMSNSISLTFGSQGIFIFGKFLKSFSGTALFLGSGLTVYQAATSKTITHLKTTFNSSWGKRSTALLWHHLQRVNLGWKPTKLTLWRNVTGTTIKVSSSFFHLESATNV